MINYPEYKSDLHHIHQSEVYGSNVFKMARRLTFNRERKAKWALLYELEVQTLERFLSYMDKTGQDYHHPSVWALRGHFEGIILAVLPWSIAMRLMAHETKSFAAIWQRLKSNFKTSETRFFDYVYAHEKAIEAFAKREYQGKDNSVEPVRSLLNNASLT